MDDTHTFCTTISVLSSTPQNYLTALTSLPLTNSAFVFSDRIVHPIQIDANSIITHTYPTTATDHPCKVCHNLRGVNGRTYWPREAFLVQSILFVATSFNAPPHPQCLNAAGTTHGAIPICASQFQFPSIPSPSDISLAHPNCRVEGHSLVLKLQ